MNDRLISNVHLSIEVRTKYGLNKYIITLSIAKIFWCICNTTQLLRSAGLSIFLEITPPLRPLSADSRTLFFGEISQNSKISTR